MGCAAQLAVAVAERRERRVVSVLFADLVGFTSRSERLDVEDVEGFLAPYQALLRGEVERTGGVVAKSTGDGVMALFGGVVAHEDDPERAVRCALGIRQSLTDATVPGERLRLRVRVGVTTGEVLVSHGAGGGVDAVGDVVNTAARLESAAPTDGILVDEFTQRATDRAIRYEAADPVSAKGKAAPVSAWLALSPVSVVPEQAREELALVGRERERALLVDALGRACDEPAAQLVTVIGEPGIGKSRLVAELFDHVEALPELITWRQGRSLSYGDGVASWALGEIVKAQAGILESDPAAVAGEKLRDAVDAVIPDGSDAGWVEGHLRPLVGLEGGGSHTAEGGRVEAFAAWRRFFEALAGQGPTVLVFEDLHWADDVLLDFVDLLADRAGRLPLLLVCTARPELLEQRSAWGGGKVNALTIQLGPLTEADAGRVISGLLDQALLPAEVQRVVLERAEGNPLYAHEYVRMLLDRGLLVRDSGGWRLEDAPEQLPESVQGIIAARLDTLSPEERRFVQDAAVIGRIAWLGAVCEVGNHTAWEAEELLHQLERKQLLRRHRSSSVAGDVEFSFAHALTQEVTYSRIRRQDRADRHERAAGWIQQLAGERDDKSELLAHHYTEALHLRQALGQDTTPIEAATQTALAEAGRQALAVSANAAATRHLESALDLACNDDPGRAGLLLDLAAARLRAHTADERVLQAAVDAQVAAGEWEAAAIAEEMLGTWAEYDAAQGDRSDLHYQRAAEYAAHIPAKRHRLYRRRSTSLSTRRARTQHGSDTQLADRAVAIAEKARLEVGRAVILFWPRLRADTAR